MAILSRSSDRLIVVHDMVCGNATRVAGMALLPDALCLSGRGRGDGVEYRFTKGSLTDYSWMAADFLLEGRQQAVLKLSLIEAGGAEFGLTFSMLNQCQARLRLPLSSVDQNVWMLGREGALLKRLCYGSRVDLREVDRMKVTLERFGPKGARWWMTSFAVSKEEPGKLENPLLPAGPLVDAIGQSTLHDWDGRTPSGVALHQRLQEQLEKAQKMEVAAEDEVEDEVEVSVAGRAGRVAAVARPRRAAGAPRCEGLTKWGGWKGKVMKATGFFRVEHDGRRWWLVDPEGSAFWSAGPDCVGMNIDSAIEGITATAKWLPAKEGPFGAAWNANKTSVDFLVSNFVRVFGEQYYAQWSKITIANLRDIGFNTVGNWSDWRMARAADFPYVRPLDFQPRQTRYVFRDFPDVFADTMPADAADYARQLVEHRGDRALIGYFLMNEPTWGFASETPTEGMLFNTEQCACREHFAAWLRRKYPGVEALSAAWGMPVTFEQVRQGRWSGKVAAGANEDLESFSTLMVERYFQLLSGECRKVDPEHINLGARYYTLPPKWALAGMRSFDVFSINCYKQRVSAGELKQIEDVTGRPTLIGEWHFGALDVGLPASGIGFVATQHDRGRAYRVYLEQAAAIPQCVGAHWFTLYDQSALGRFDGENYNIGFFDVCNRPYEELCAAARESHRRMYEVAAGRQRAFDNAPAYFPPLFM